MRVVRAFGAVPSLVLSYLANQSTPRGTAGSMRKPVTETIDATDTPGVSDEDNNPAEPGAGRRA